MINYKELEDKVYNYTTKYKEGFTDKEIKELLKKYPDVKMDKFNDAMRGNTCQAKTENDKLIIVNYHCDVLQALICGLEDRKLTAYEWD